MSRRASSLALVLLTVFLVSTAFLVMHSPVLAAPPSAPPPADELRYLPLPPPMFAPGRRDAPPIASGFQFMYGPSDWIGLGLNETQQDKIFEIQHAAAPALREQMKLLYKARASLRDLVRAAQFDAAQANGDAQIAGQAQAQLELLQLRLDHDLFMVLTAEQRATLSELESEKQELTPRRIGRPAEPIPRSDSTH